MDTTLLFRPVGPQELALIAKSDYREFPPRLPHQPIFYPVLNEEYATQIARDWNAADAATGISGAARLGPLQGIGLKAQKKNGSGRGRMRAGAGSHDEQRTLQFTRKICGGRFPRHPRVYRLHITAE